MGIRSTMLTRNRPQASTVGLRPRSNRAGLLRPGTIRGWLASATLLLLASGASAQSLVGSVAGTVRDEQGGALPGTVVTLVGPMGMTIAHTAADGAYRFPAVAPGLYEVVIGLAGFNSRRVPAVKVGIGGQLVLDVVLTVQTRTESVEVVAEAPIVDVKSSSTSTDLAPSLLFQLPLSRLSFRLLDALPAINNASAFGGGARAANSLRLDGVEGRDPEQGESSVLLSYNVVQEVQVQGVGASAEYGGFTGAVVNTVTRSGGNLWRGLVDLQFSNQDLSSDNVSEEVAAQNPGLAAPYRLNHLLDLTAQAGGPLVKDRLFFFSSLQRYRANLDPRGPRTKFDDYSRVFNTKISWQPGPRNQVTAMLQYDRLEVEGTPGVPPLQANDALSGSTEKPELVWSLQWRRLLGSSSFVEARYLGWSSRNDFTPNVPASQHVDLATGEVSVSAGYSFGYRANRQQAVVSFSHHAERFLGTHDFKFGVELERSHADSRFAFVDGLQLYDYYGAPYGAVSYGYDVSLENRRESVYAQDAWRVSPRLTVSPGLRFDRIRGGGPDAAAVYETNSLAPRLGVAFDLTERQTAVLKASYGRYHEGALGSYYKRALPGFDDTVYYAADAGGLVEIDRVAAVPYGIASGLRHPRVDEITAGFEKALRADLRFAVTGIVRRNANFVDSVGPDLRWRAFETINLLTGAPLTAYARVRPASGEARYTIVNVDQVAYLAPGGEPVGSVSTFRDYRALMVVLSKRLRGRSQAQVSYVLSRSRGTVDNRFLNSIGSSGQFESANSALVDTEGHLSFDRRHELKVLASALLPRVEVDLSAQYQLTSGTNYAPFQRVVARGLDSPGNVLVEPRGSRSNPLVSILDLRVEKAFRLAGGTQRLGLYVDFTNVFNAGTVIETQSRVPGLVIPGVATPVVFGAPLELVPARQIVVGGRWSLR